MGTCGETICKHRILFPSIQHLAWLPHGRPQGKQKFGKNSFSSVRSVSVGFFYIAHYRTLHIALVFCLLVFFNYYHSWRIKMSIAIFGLMHWLKHRITRKLLKTDRYMLRGVWQALNCLSIHATYCVIIAGTSPGETKMWAAVRKNGDFLHLWFE